MAKTNSLKEINDNPLCKVRSLYPTEQREFTPQEQQEIKDAFPDIDPGYVPNGNRVIVQLRVLPEKTKGGIILTQASADQALYEEQIGRVVAIGSSAFHSQTTMTPWPEGEWYGVGDYVRVPKFGGDKTWTKISDDKKGLFILFFERDILGRITGNPLAIKGYI